MNKRLLRCTRPAEFDHLMVVMNRIIHDARTLNVARSLHNQGERVGIIGYANSEDQTELDKLDLPIYSLDWPRHRRMSSLWLHFLSHIGRARSLFNATHYWAMDLYATPFVYGIRGTEQANTIYDAREIYTALGPNRNQPLKQQVISAIESFFIKRFDKVITTGELDSKFLVQEYEIATPPVLMNLPPYQEVKPNNRLRKRFKIPSNHTVLVYQGMIYKGRGVDRIVSVLPHLRNVTLVAIGSGGGVEVARNQADQLGVANRFHILNPVPYDELLNWTASADIGICFFEPLTLSLKYALPNKLFEYAMAGIPVLATALPQIKPLLEKVPAGDLVDPSISERALSQALENMICRVENNVYNDPVKRMREQYHWEAQESTIINII
jgi:glycosyltransferase involved in cell wall biosynthesis